MSSVKPIPIKCGSCGIVFSPDPRSRDAWVCDACGAKNPNLRRHYRSLGILWIFALAIATMVGLGLLLEAGTIDYLLLLTWALSLAIVIAIYGSRAPWMSTPTKVLIWVGIAFALFGNVLYPLIFRDQFSPLRAAVTTVVFAYVCWLQIQARKCSVREEEKAANQSS